MGLSHENAPPTSLQVQVNQLLAPDWLPTWQNDCQLSWLSPHPEHNRACNQRVDISYAYCTNEPRSRQDLIGRILVGGREIWLDIFRDVKRYDSDETCWRSFTLALSWTRATANMLQAKEGGCCWLSETHLFTFHNNNLSGRTLIKTIPSICVLKTPSAMRQAWKWQEGDKNSALWQYREEINLDLVFWFQQYRELIWCSLLINM